MMAKILLTLTLICSISMIFSTHPLTMVGILMMQTTIITLMMNLIQTSNWINLIMFLLVMGNMMILFMYTVSLTPNEAIDSTTYTPTYYFLFPAPITIMAFSNSWINKHPNETLHESNSMNHQPYMNETTLLVKQFSYNMNSLTAIFMLLMLCNLCTTTLVTSSHEGPMRKTN